MRLKNLTAYLLLGFIATSCIKDEAPNAEADIETCTVPGDVLNREPIIENDRVTLILKKGTDVTALAPEFTLTPGATIAPQSGSPLNFTEPQLYVVTSQDGNWKKTYRVEATFSGVTNTTYRFENVRLNNNTSSAYQIFYETDQFGRETMAWASGNPGFVMTGVAKSFSDYPTYQINEGYKNKCLALITRRTGSLGPLVNMPLAAGNLFIGKFIVANALQNALTATLFGSQFEYIPKYLKGHYKYTAGETFYELDKSREDKLKPVPGRKDIFDIYAVFFESTADMENLDGTNMLSEDNPNILAIARISDAHETDQWTEFNLPFVFREGKTIDPKKLADGKYSLTIVFSSSIRGDHFEGAEGSTLLIDEVELGYEDQEVEQ